MKKEILVHDPSLPLIYPITGLICHPRSTIRLTPLELTECGGTFDVQITSYYGRLSLPSGLPITELVSAGQPGISITNVTALEVNSWFATLFYQNIMYDTKPYTDYVSISIKKNDEWSDFKIAKMALQVERPEIPLFMSSINVRTDFTYIIPEKDDFEAKTTIILKVGVLIYRFESFN